ncbi:MAG TPA: FIST C-terminal domain-containing protein, partial [Polyangiaceae bacterium]|nr:FIST C-terminal domain-containing protein [Polyangiaceae bacterium]
MGSSARSFEVRSDRSERVASAALRAAVHAGERGVGLLFLSGDLIRQAQQVVDGLSRASRVPWLVCCVRGVLTERAEIENESAAVGLVAPDVEARAVLGSSADSRFGVELATRLQEARRASALVFSSAPPDRDGWLVELNHRLRGKLGRVFGAGTLPQTHVHWVPPAGQGTPVAADTGGLVMTSALVPRIFSTSACRLISPLGRVTKSRGPLLLELDGSPALPLLSEAARDLRGDPLVLVAVAIGDKPLSPEGRSLSIRAIVGVDPSQGAILLAEELAEGTRLAFAVRDSTAARTDLAAHLGAHRRALSGSAPHFGFYASCAGRGRSLYHAADVDVRLIREHFPEMPLVGLHSTFELSPEDDKLGMRIYTGVL